MNQKETILEIKKVSKTFGGLTALINVTLDIGRGMIFGLIGPNGAGKTTLFNIITGVNKATNGNIIFKGHDITYYQSDKIANLGIARTFQNIRLFGEMTVLENVMVGQHRLGKSGLTSLIPFYQRSSEKKLREDAMTLLSFMGLDQRKDDVAKELPYGQQRKLEIGRALATKPEIILVDEPAAGMNDEEVSELAKDIMKIRSMGCTVFLIDHHVSFMMELCDRIAVLNFGHKIAEGTTFEIQEAHQVREAYLGGN